VPGDDTAFRIDEHGVIETELGDAGGDLPDLDSGMGCAHCARKAEADRSAGIRREEWALEFAWKYLLEWD
jgi:hypothetical protein